MGTGPDRPGQSQGDLALARLAAKGQQRIREASARVDAAAHLAAEEDRDRYLRDALAGYYGRPVLRTVSILLMVLGVLIIGVLVGTSPRWPAVMPVSSDVIIGTGAVLFVVCFIGGLALLSIRPVASRARVAAEGAWVSTLPFALEGYFTVLADTPVSTCRLEIELTWDGPLPSPEIVQGILGVIDTSAQALSAEGGAVHRIRTGPVSGDTWRSWSDDDLSLCNQRLVAYVHTLVDKVLLPLHQRHAIARVAVKRES